MVSEPPRPSVVTSLVVGFTPWNPATMATDPCASVCRMRLGVTSMIRALPYDSSVITPGLLPGERLGLDAQVVDRHGQERHRDALPGGQQDVHLTLRRERGDLLGEVDELVGGVAHGADHHDDVVTGALGLRHPLRDALDAGGVGDGGTAVLLHDQGHGELFRGLGQDRASVRACPPGGQRVSDGGSWPLTRSRPTLPVGAADLHRTCTGSRAKHARPGAARS